MNLNNYTIPACLAPAVRDAIAMAIHAAESDYALADAASDTAAVKIRHEAAARLDAVVLDLAHRLATAILPSYAAPVGATVVTEEHTALADAIAKLTARATQMRW